MKGINARFELLNRFSGQATIISIHKTSIEKGVHGEEFEPGEYVAVSVTGGDHGNEGEPETNHSTTETTLMSKSEARAVASSLMACAASI